MTKITQTREFTEAINAFEGHLLELKGFVSSLTSIQDRHLVGIYEEIERIESTVQLFKENTDKMPDTIANNYYEKILSFNDVLYDKFINYNITDPEFNSSVINTITVIAEALQSNHEALNRYLASIEKDQKDLDSRRTKHTIESLLKEINIIKQQTTNDARHIESIKQTLQEEIIALNTKYKDDLARFENISQALTFQNASESYQQTANSWRKTVITLCAILLLLLVVFAYWTWIDFGNIQNQLGDGNINASDTRINTLFYYEIISKSILRILVLSLAVFFIKFSVKNYYAAKHNMIINLHKANSLATASRLIATSPDTETFNAIITLAAKEIFTQPKTGFLLKDDSKVDIGLLNDTFSTFTKKNL